MSNSGVAEALLERLNALGRAQARSLYLILVAGNYYTYTHYKLGIGYAHPGSLTTQPPFGVEVIEPVFFFSTTPLVLGLLTLSGLGAIAAAHSAMDKFEKLSIGKRLRPFCDRQPNLIDCAFYHDKATLKPLRALAIIAYPLFFTAATIGAIYLPAREVLSGSLYGWSLITLILGGIIWIFAVARLIGHWRLRLQMVRDLE